MENKGFDLNDVSLILHSIAIPAPKLKYAGKSSKTIVKMNSRVK